MNRTALYYLSFSTIVALSLFIVGLTTTQAILYDLQPLEDVYVEGKPPEIVNITPNSAQLLFESSIPLACSVVYGETTAYGKLALDPTMNGGAITDHQPTLGGLKSQTTYFYRLQGTALDGTMYISEVMSFTTAITTEQNEINLASLNEGAMITQVSSNFGGVANHQTWGANSAIDENPATAWSSNGDGDDAFLEITLAQPGTPHAIEVWTRRMSNNTAQIFTFTLTADTGQQFGPFHLPSASQAYRFGIAVTQTIETVRFDVVTSNGGNTGLVALAIYDKPLATLQQDYIPHIQGGR